MGMAPEDFEFFKAHLSGHAYSGCPICSSSEWEADGPLAMPRLVFGQNTPNGVLISNEVMPVAVMYCRKCFFVRHFVWGLIQAKARR